MVRNNPRARPSTGHPYRRWCLLFCLIIVAFSERARAVQDSLVGSVSTTLPNPFPSGGEEFGCAIASVGTNQLLVGAWRDQGGAGAAYLYGHDGTLLTTFTNVTSQSTNSVPNPFQSAAGFGFAVAALGGNRVVIGAPNRNSSALGDGAAFLFNIDGTPLVTFTNPAPANSDKFGSTIAIVGGDQVLIGAYLADIARPSGGAAYLYSTNGELLKVFTNSTSFGFGAAVAALGREHILVGAWNLGTVGSVYLFHIDGALVTTFTNPVPAGSDRFGWSVAGVGSDKVLVGASAHASFTGQAYLFNTNGAHLTTFTNPAPWRWVGDEFGRSVAALGPDKILISAHKNDAGGGNDGGVVHVFSHDATLLTTLTNPTPPGIDFFGYGLAPIGSDKVAVGAICHTVEGFFGAGSAYLLNLTEATPLLRLEQLANNEVCISWPGPATGFVLDTTSLAFPLSTNVWSQVPFPYQTNGGRISILATCAGQQFFRLRKP